MECKVCVAARDLNALARHVGAPRTLRGWSVERAVVVESRARRQLWIGTGSGLPLNLDEVWAAAFPSETIPPGYRMGPALDTTGARLRGFGYVRVSIRPPGAVLDRWVPQELFDDPLLWAIYSAPQPFE